jgi:acetyl esterase/lipase
MQAEWVKPPKADSNRVILYFHGGGYCFGSRETFRGMVAHLAIAAEARALLIDYRLAPEHPFPAALDDAVSAYRWLLGQGIAPSSIVLAGDSAGGGLAIATAMALRDGGAPLPRAIVTMSPWTDLALTGMSVLANQKRDAVLRWDALSLCARHYLRKTLPTNPFASPYYGNFKGLPPLLIHAGSEELLKDDATRIAEKAEAAGCEVSCEIWDGMPHAFQYFCDLKEAAGSLDRIGSFIRSRVPAPASAPAPGKTEADRRNVSPFRRPQAANG